MTDTDPITGPITDPVAALLVSAVGLLVESLRSGAVNGPDGEHAFYVDGDGDGYQEPLYDEYGCTCGNWNLTWQQPDPEHSGRPRSADMLLAWQHHYSQALGEVDVNEPAPTLGYEGARATP